jgi:Tfp pilus assembly protein PilO
MRNDRVHSTDVAQRRNQYTKRTTAVAAALGLLAGLLMWCALEFVSIRPLATDADRLAAELQAVRDENGRTESMIANYEAFRVEAERVEADYADALAAVPSEAELAAALADVERVTGASGVRLVAFEPAKLAPKPAAAIPTNATGAPAPQAVVEARPVAVVIHSRYEPTQSLLDRLATYPRLLTVESFTLRSHNTGAYTTEASLTLNCYYKVAPPAATAAASAR